MVLRRVTEHVKAQNWTAVALDFVIVIAGVFIGIQVSNWNASRQERSLERDYVERLHADFALSIENAEDNIQAMERQYRYEGAILDRLAECRLGDEEQGDFATGLYLVGRLEPPPLVRATIDELRSTGRMGIIRSTRLRDRLRDIVRLQQRNAEVLDYIIARATPHIVYVDQRVVYDQPPGGFGAVASDGVPSDRISFDFQALCQDPLYTGSVSALQEVTRVVISHNQARLEDYREFIGMLEGELGDSR